ncbi:KRAB-A domain-containing protein 2-like [Anoplolepis gracilipes]|uniref:KRAB-A domain-containing protein 2-like n=1 Tax=Anoplolepis gracilipes TaxID=354296 RepID=UPI003BA2F247
MVIEPLLFKKIHACAQVDLIDMQTCSDRNFKYILNYQDHLTKFVILRPIQMKTAEKVAHILLDIFCILGASSVLQSDNGREFANRVIEELKVTWSELSIVHSKPRHSHSQGSVERANQDVQKILFAWMEDNKTNH